MSVSYANVAANGTVSKSEGAAEDSASPAPSTSPVPASSASNAATEPKGEAEPTAEPRDAEVAESSEAAAPAKKEKKVLAPAPVPSKAVWGTTAQPQTAAVDEYKWPTPDKVLEVQTPNKASKFIKPNKWVPINAKVILPSPRAAQSNGASQQKTKRKNKNTKKKTIASPVGEGKKDESSLPRDDDEHAEFSDEKPAELLHDSLESDLHNYNDQHDNRQRYPGGQQQKGYRRYQNGAPAHKGGAQPRPANGYYQQYVPSQYQNYNGSRQARPQVNGAQLGRNNSNPNLQNYAANGFHPMAMPFVPLPQHPQPMMVQGMPFGSPIPVQIPPPISPKQNPQQALTQQIDYYFSLENLIRDVFLRKNMGTEGWVDLDLILNFKRVKIIVNGIRNAIEEANEDTRAEKLDNAILKAVQLCQNLEIGYLNGKEDYNATATEVQLRVKGSFEQWLLPDN